MLKRNISILIVYILMAANFSHATTSNNVSSTDKTAPVENKQSFLPVDQAFALSHEAQGAQLKIHWDIAGGYYLYQKRIQIKAGGEEFEIENLPQAELKHDPYFGEVLVYHDDLTIVIEPGEFNILEVSYQGCAEKGLCYPPQTRSISLYGQPVEKEYGSSSSKYLNSFSDKSKLYTLFIYFLVGVATAFAGCSYPMFPILSKIIVGQKNATKLKSFTLSLSYVLPIAFVYAGIGILAGSFGSNLANWFQQPIALVLVSLTLFIMALSMFGLFEIQMPSSIQSKLSTISGKQSGGSYVSAALMGFISAFIVSACVVPPVVAAVTYITKTGDIWLGATAMFVFGIGLGFPLLLLGLSAGWLLPKAGNWMNKIQGIMAIFLLTAAIWILDRIIPDWITYLLWASLAIFSSIYITRLFSSKYAVGISVLSGVLALCLLGFSFVKFFEQDIHDFEYVTSISEIESTIDNNETKIIMIDVYADWCTACKKMENHVFKEPAVALQLEQMKKLKLDLSQINEQKKEVMKKYKIIGPPAFIFLTPDGNELESLRVIGELDSEAFAEVLAQALKKAPGDNND